mgnify:CR=1 FL=1
MRRYTQIYERTNEIQKLIVSGAILPIEKNIKLKISSTLSKKLSDRFELSDNFFYFFIENFNEIYYETKKERN